MQSNPDYADRGTGLSSVVSVTPRLFSAPEAARYLGYKSADALKRIPVRPIMITEGARRGAPRWDRKAIDLWLDGLSSLSENSNNSIAEIEDLDAELQAWKLRHGR